MQDVTIKQLKKIFDSFENIEFAYLFGSFATDKISNHSDIDIAIYVKEGFDSFDAGLQVHHKLEIALHKDIDVVVLNDVKNYRLLKDIIYKGVLLKDGKNRSMFEVRKQHEIIDFFNFKRILDVV